MDLNAEKLNKLRAMSVNDLVGRSRQELFKLADRLFIARAGEMSDEALYREFGRAARNGSGEGTSDLLRDRLRAGKSPFLPSLNERRAIVEMMNRRFPAERDWIIATAEKAIEGRFDLLGYADLEFGNPIDWHLDPRTGDRGPLIHWSKIDPVVPVGNGDLKVFWEIQRHANAVTLGQAYWLTGDERYAEAFVNQVSSWIDKNPLGLGIGWAASLDVAFRAISWLWALHLCAGSREVSAEFTARIVKSLIEHGRHIEKYLSTYFSPNTHLTGEALGLFYLGVALPELRRAEAWRQMGLRVLIEELPRHVRNDGVYFEQSSYYHRYTSDFYTHLFAIVRAREIALGREDERLLWQKLEGLFDFLMWIERPDNTWPLFGDDDGGRLVKFGPRAANDFSDTLAMGAAIFKRGDWKHAAGRTPSEMLWLLGTEAIECYDRVAPISPRETARGFSASGYFVMRDGWERDSSFVFIDCGRHGSEAGFGHAHADALSIELAARGTTWLVDPATFVYGADPQTRDEFRSTRAHNTAMVDGEDQSAPAAPFAWTSAANCTLRQFEDLGDSAVFEGSHDGYQRLSDPVTHTRSVLMLRNKTAVFVTDNFTANARHDFAIRYHFAPGCETEVIDGRIEARMPDGERLWINLFHNRAGQVELKTRIESGWVSTCYGQRTPAPIGVFEASAAGSVEFTTVILAGAG